MCRVRRVIFYIIIASLSGLGSCGSDSATGINFDRGPMLDNFANNLIKPAYTDLTETTQVMQSAGVAFIDDVSLINLEALKESYLEAYAAFQHAAIYNFGPADDLFFSAALNSYPTNTTLIEDNVGAGTYNLALATNNSAKGFPALDYLLFVGDPLSDFSDQNRKDYLTALLADISDRSGALYEAWFSSGDYVTDFVSKKGNDVSSSSSMLINGVIQYVESAVRDEKIAIPLGVRSNGVPIPANVETPYSMNSILLASEAVEELKALYTGGDGIGLDDYLMAVNAKINQSSLSEVLEDQLDLTINKLALVPEPYAETVESATDKVFANAAYQELQKLVLLMKSDMTSAMGILITYQDNDGD